MSAPTARLIHHGAAASSHRNVVAWVPSCHGGDQESSASHANEGASTLVYASHAVLNLAQPDRVSVVAKEDNNDNESSTTTKPTTTDEPVWHVTSTLCTQTTTKDNSDSGPEHVITCLSSVVDAVNESSLFSAALVAGFADGTVTLWTRHTEEEVWLETPIATLSSQLPITCLSSYWVESHATLLVLGGTSAGARLYECQLRSSQNQVELVECQSTVLLQDAAICSVGLFCQGQDSHEILALIGTAAPRHNKIHVLHTSTTLTSKNDSNNIHFHFQYSGSLTGHEDWISDMAWTELKSKYAMLATSSQDARIRLWKFMVSTTTVGREEEEPESVPHPQPVDDNLSEDENAHEDEEDDEEAGESRLDIYHHPNVTRVTLEALLIGHEEAVTSVCWYHQSKAVYNQDHLLLSSSMDRSIFFWTPGVDGIWAPLTRVGSAGGILGGSVGSTLLGYLHVSVEPSRGMSLMGHAYGGAIHVWDLDQPNSDTANDPSHSEPATTEELASRVYWKASPCITGHFSGVVDLCWEASRGHYLLTASEDQTCRLWAPSKSAQPIWLELARPQVHGYNMAAITSLSCPQHPHFLVSGGDEKELRAFEAPLTTLRILERVSGVEWHGNKENGDPIQRVERAYIPSLGLSNKATVADSAEEDAPASNEPSHSTVSARLPLERDLGVESLWPEVQKLFGHTTELYCVASTLEAKSVYNNDNTEMTEHPVLVASTCKARDEDAAAIRLWRAHEGTSHQVLSSGHKSTVATLAFSPNGQFLASSGKDRRLCFWKRQQDGQFQLAWAKESAHKRIVWSVHFLPFDAEGEHNQILASGSRDGCVKIWSIVDRGGETGPMQVSVLCSFAPSFAVGGKPDSATALSFCPCRLSSNTVLLALGLDSGRIELWNVPLDNGTPSLVLPLEPNLCHLATVKKLAWRPVSSDAKHAQKLILASCSLDHGCRLFEIQMQ